MTLDVKGNLIVREIPVIEQEDNFYSLGYNDRNEIVTKSKEVSEYSTYLGFQPMADSHTKVLPLKLEENYITILKGFAIGVCYGVKIDFELTFIGEGLSV